MATKKASWSDFESKVQRLKKLKKCKPTKDVANQFSTPGSTLATLKKAKKISLELFKIHPWNDKEWKLEHTKS